MNYYKSAKLLSWSCNMTTLEMRLFNAAIAVFQEVGKLPIKIPYTLLNEVFEGWNKGSTLRAIECIDLREFVTQQSLANMLGEKMNTTISLSTIKRAICALVEQGCVEIRRHGDESPCTYVAIRPLGVTLLQSTSRREKLIIQRNINSLTTQ